MQASAPAIPRVPPAPSTAPAPASRGWRWWIAGLGIVGALVCCVAVGAYALPLLTAQSSTPPPATTAPVLPSEAPTGPAVTEFVAALPSLPPANTPTQAPTPTATYPPLYARIDSITINASNQYVVVYETFGYTEALPGRHVHFFFDTVPPDQAGSPGVGPWVLYGGPRPFTGYSVSQRPAGATQMCALVAHPDHSVVAGSGNCVDLPLPP